MDSSVAEPNKPSDTIREPFRSLTHFGGFVTVYPMNPKAAQRFRDRKAPSGAKNDPLDARCFADALRTDGHGWRELRPLDPLTAELRILCRDEIALIEQRTAKQLHTLQAQLDVYRNRITELFSHHPDHDCFGSLPGAGPKIAPRLLGELGNDRTRFQSHEALQAYAGTAPVTLQSGKRSIAKMRRACNKTLRATVHHWADLSRPLCAWAQAYYQQKKDQGMSHAQALRCLGQRWLKILWKMWQTRTTYNEALHTRNQVDHGSWVVGLMNSATGPTTH